MSLHPDPERRRARARFVRTIRSALDRSIMTGAGTITAAHNTETSTALEGSDGNPVWLGPRFTLSRVTVTDLRKAGIPEYEHCYTHYQAKESFKHKHGLGLGRDLDTDTERDGSSVPEGQLGDSMPTTCILEGHLKLSTHGVRHEVRSEVHDDLANQLEQRGIHLPPRSELRLRSAPGTATVYILEKDSLMHRLVSPSSAGAGGGGGGGDAEAVWQVPQLDANGEPSIHGDGSGMSLLTFAEGDRCRNILSGKIKYVDPKAAQLSEYALVATEDDCFLAPLKLDMEYTSMRAPTDKDELSEVDDSTAARAA